MQHDAVRDGRHLMAQDDDPDAAWIDGDAFYAECLRLMKPRLVTAQFFGGDTPDHPNYRYPQERTGDSTV